ncbi:MAG: helix-turn-helix domain-containing protein [Terriglobales bacterium]|jgi:DNA-binding NtrC family response regulator
MEASSDVESRVEYERRRVELLDAVEPLTVQVVTFERRVIAEMIELCQGNHQEAAIRLGIGRVTLYRKLRRKA